MPLYFILTFVCGHYEFDKGPSSQSLKVNADWISTFHLLDSHEKRIDLKNLILVS